MLQKNKVVLGLSGGVDSAAAALLLQQKGFAVIGYYFDISGNNMQGRQEAQRAADELGIPLCTEDVSALFSDVVVADFCDAYARGRTPNPCIVCNPNVKFKRLLAVADAQGAFYIATGHYARIAHDAQTGLYAIRQGASLARDQSYMLYRLGQEALSRLIFPLGEIEDKAQIRDLARAERLSNADKKDSQEICFVPDDDYVQFLQRHGICVPEGDFVDAAGKVLGRHRGIIRYTIGQRKGLGIALGKPAFVTAIDPVKNKVVLGDNADLFSTEVVSTDHVFAGDTAQFMEAVSAAAAEHTLKAKVRYSVKPSDVEKITLDGADRLTTVFCAPQRAATPGQSIVFYRGDVVIGGGFIA